VFPDGSVYHLRRNCPAMKNESGKVKYCTGRNLGIPCETCGKWVLGVLQEDSEDGEYSEENEDSEEGEYSEESEDSEEDED